MKKNGRKYVYCIFYIEGNKYKSINKHLLEEGFTDLKAIIPSVSILKRTRKNTMVFEDKPILFNYGFIRMPRYKSFSRTFLNTVRRKIPGIRFWVKDTITLHPSKKRKRIDNVDDWDDFSLVATCSRKEVRRFIRIARDNKKYSIDDLVNLKIGDYVHLKGYPYEGVGATVTDINLKNRTVSVCMEVLYGTMSLTLPFDNVLYSVYMNYEPDQLYAPFLGDKEAFVTEDKVNHIFNLKQY